MTARFKVGDKVRAVSGGFVGLDGTVLSLLPDGESVEVESWLNHDIFAIYESDLAPLGVVPCPPEHADAALRGLVSAARVVEEQLATLHRGLLEVGDAQNARLVAFTGRCVYRVAERLAKRSA